jgi:hypothetical protein
MVRFSLRPLYLRGKNATIHWTGGWVGSRAGLDAVEERKIYFPCRESKHRRQTHSQFLYRLKNPFPHLPTNTAVGICGTYHVQHIHLPGSCQSCQHGTGFTIVANRWQQNLHRGAPDLPVPANTVSYFTHLYLNNPCYRLSCALICCERLWAGGMCD